MGGGGGGGGDGLREDKANLSPAKLKLADIGLELSLAKQLGLIFLLKLKAVIYETIATYPTQTYNVVIMRE